MKNFKTLVLKACVFINMLLTGSLCVNAEASSAATEIATEAISETSRTGAGLNWPVIIGVSSIISFIIAIILAVRKADKVYGKGFDD